jgi:hypothetical protein
MANGRCERCFPSRRDRGCEREKCGWYQVDDLPPEGALGRLVEAYRTQIWALKEEIEELKEDLRIYKGEATDGEKEDAAT